MTTDLKGREAMTADPLQAPEPPVSAVPTPENPGNPPSGDLERADGHPEPGPDLLDALEESLRKARAARSAETKRQRSHATGFRIGQTVTISAPRSPRYHGRSGAVEATSLGEVQVLGAWFLPGELTRGAR